MAQKKAKLDKAIDLPEGVTATHQDTVLTVKGPKGENVRSFEIPNAEISVKDGKVLITPKKSTQREKKNIGSAQAHIKNMIAGSIEPHVYKLKICSGHFPMNVSVSGEKVIIKNFLGEKVPRELQIKKGAAVKVDGDIITVESCSKEVAGQVSADIETLTRRANFDTRIFQDGIYIIHKDGKDIK